MKVGAQWPKDVEGGRCKAGSRNGSVWTQGNDTEGPWSRGWEGRRSCRRRKACTGTRADPEVEGMMPFVAVALDHKRNGRSKRQTSSTWAPQRQTLYQINVGYGHGGGGLGRRLMRGARPGLLDDGVRYGLFCLLVAGGCTWRTPRHLRASRSKTRAGVWTMSIRARGDWLQMPGLVEQRDRPFRVTPGVLIEGVLKAGARLQRHLAAAG